MDLFLTEQQRRLQAEVREFARTRVAARAPELDARGEFPHDLIAEMGERGWMGIPVPREYGGAGLDNVSYIIAVHEISRICGSTGITLAAHTSLGTAPILSFGSREQKERYLPELASGKSLGAFGLTETEAGSDAGGTRTTARPHDDGWIINGGKNFITNASYCKTLVFTAVTDPARKSHGISSFLVEAGTPGFQVGKKENKMGLRGSNTVQLHFDNCLLPRENILGEPNQGFRQFLTILDGGRISIGALALGVAEGALDVCRKYFHDRRRAGARISQSVQFRLADMATQVEAARLLVYQAAFLKDAGRDYVRASAMAKLHAAETGMAVTTAALALLGEDGHTAEYPVERMFRDAKLMEIGEGTSEIQRLVISRTLFS